MGEQDGSAEARAVASPPRQGGPLFWGAGLQHASPCPAAAPIADVLKLLSAAGEKRVHPAAPGAIPCHLLPPWLWPVRAPGSPGELGGRNTAGPFPRGQQKPSKHQQLLARELPQMPPLQPPCQGWEPDARLRCFLSSPAAISTRAWPRPAPGAVSMNLIAFQWRFCR